MNGGSFGYIDELVPREGYRGNRDDKQGKDSAPHRIFSPPNGPGIELPAARECTRNRPAAARRIDPPTGRRPAGSPGRPGGGGASAAGPCCAAGLRCAVLENVGPRALLEVT